MKSSVVAATAVGAVTIAALLTGCGSSTPTSATGRSAPSTPAAVASAAGTPTAGASSAGTASAGTPATGAATPGSAGTAAVVNVGDKDKGHTVTVHQGQRVALVLTGGYWQVAGSSAPAVVRQDGAPSYLSPSPASCAPGMGCRPQETDFTALSVGTATLTASRTSCGEARPCTAGQGSYRVTISVVAA
jgi:hypothetical protein